jgi:uncharacterized protein YbbC (DUF1343 family)
VGLHPLPIRHGMTVGELALLFRAERGLDLDLRVVKMRGWRRAMSYEATGLPWVLPSPNMPTPDTALVYPGLCLLEGTNISEGRGTTRPFEIFGAPFLDGYRLAERLGEAELPGVRFRPLTFRPTFHKFAGQVCGGAQVHVVDRAAFLPYLTGVEILRSLAALAGESFRWRTERYEFVSDRPAIDLLTGGDAVRRGIAAGATLPELRATWSEAEAAFAERRRACLLY